MHKKSLVSKSTIGHFWSNKRSSIRLLQLPMVQVGLIKEEPIHSKPYGTSAYLTPFTSKFDADCPKRLWKCKLCSVRSLWLAWLLSIRRDCWGSRWSGFSPTWSRSLDWSPRSRSITFMSVRAFSARSAHPELAAGLAGLGWIRNSTRTFFKEFSRTSFLARVSEKTFLSQVRQTRWRATETAKSDPVASEAPFGT